MSVNQYNITKLNGSNYQIWKYKVELLLLKEELWSVVSEEPASEQNQEWKNKDGKARATIGLLLEDSQVIHIRNCKTAREAWQTLKSQYEKPTLTNKVFLLKRLCRMTLAENADMSNHISTIVNLIDQLTALGENIAENLQVALLLCSLPESYENLVTALEGRADDDLTMELVKSKLIQEFERRRESSREIDISNEDVALKTKMRGNVYVKRDNKEKLCYYCKKSGHLKQDCYHYKRNNGKYDKARVVNNDTSGDEESDENYCFNVSDKITSEWYIDSGASSHMTNDRSFFTEYQESKSYVELADGRKIISNGVGVGKLKCLNDNNKTTVILVKNVLFVPDLGTSLLSVNKLTKLGFKVEFDKDVCYIKANNKVLAKGTIHGKLYKLINNNQAMNVTTKEFSEGCIHLWHRRFGHRDPNAIYLMKKESLVEGLKLRSCGHKITCEVCIQGKMSKKPFPKKSLTKSNNILDLIHTDLCGPMHTITPGGKRYVLSFIDDYSKYTTVYLIRSKDEVLEKLREFVKLMQNKFHKKPKVLRSDRGKEYVNKAVKDFLKKEGIEMQLTAPYSSQQNGVAERKNRYLIEMTRCLLIDANLPNTYWGEAIITANFLENLSPTKGNGNKIPYTLWFKEKPKVNNLKVFGSTVYALVPKQKRKKIQETAKKYTFLGYEMGTKAYRLLDRNTGKVIISKDTEFLEDNHNGFHSTCKRHNDFNSREECENKEVDIYCHTNIPIKVQEMSENEIEDQESEKINENNNVTLRRSERIASKREQNHIVNDDEIMIEPRTRKEALTRKDAHKWIAAMDEEMESMKSNKTWTLTNFPKDKTIVGSKWIFKLKKDSNGRIVRHKARIVAQGFTQKYGLDYDEVFAPVAKPFTFRIMLTIAGMENLEILHYDFKTAFLNSNLNEEIYLKQPEGYVKDGNENKVYKLNKCIYGLKQAARMWNSTIDLVLQEIGFSKGNFDQCLYINKTKNMYILIFVDDLLIACDNVTYIEETIKKLSKKFEITFIGKVENYIGIQVRKDENGIYTIGQRNYVKKVLNNLNLNTSKSSKIPLDTGYYKNREQQQEEFLRPDDYRKAVGSLLYLSVNTRPDVSVAASILGRQVAKPYMYDWKEMKRVAKYLKGTINTEIKMGNKEETEEILYGYADADWAGDKEDRKSNSGYVFIYKGALIDWCCRKQTCVALSSTEAEFIALAEACQQAVFLKNIFEDFGKEIVNIIMYEDNQAALKMLDHGKMSNRTKHIETKYNFIKDLKQKNIIKFEYCPTNDMLADLLTKPMSQEKLSYFKKELQIQNSS